MRHKWVIAIGLVGLLLLGGTWYLWNPDESTSTHIVSTGDLMPGLLGIYSDDSHQVRVIAPTPNFYLEPGESLHPALSPEFEAQWIGVISIFETGAYSFRAGTAEIYLNGDRVEGESVRLAAGRHALEIRYRRDAQTAQMRLLWDSNHFPTEPVPTSVLFHSASQSVEPQEDLIGKGRLLVQEFGCVNCHEADSSSLHGRQGPDLGGIGSRTNARWLTRWLENPQDFRRGAVMPVMLTAEERQDVVAYLVSLKGGDHRKTAVSAGAEDLIEGRRLYGSLGCLACHEQDGLSLEGMGSKTNLASLADYLKDPNRLDPGGRMPSFMLDDQQSLSLAAFLLDSTNSEFERPVSLGDPHRGREMVQAEGCLSCHAIQGVSQASGQYRAPALEELDEMSGCLESELSQDVPRYRLSEDQRQAIRSFLRSYREHPDRSPAPVHRLREAVQQLRCVACHEFDRLGPKINLPEGVPPLTAAGAKLRTSWLEKVLLHRERVRAWIDLRMPEYAPDHVKPLVEKFARAAGVKPGEGSEGPLLTTDLQQEGITMIGADAIEGGLACIRCHDWGEYEGLGERGPQLRNVTDRVRYDWFYRFVLNPSRIYSGTSMPDHFSAASREDTEQAIKNLWAALSMGENMPLPDGLVPAEEALGPDARPVPEKSPVIVRCYMPGATSASIAVGMPGGISYCFDAATSQLRYVWKGGFLDLTEWMSVKAGEHGYTPTAELLGEVFYETKEFPFRLDRKEDALQPDFRGYRLIEGYPEFHYQLRGLDVYERVLPDEKQEGIRRLFRIPLLDRSMWFVAGSTERSRIRSTLGDPEDGVLEIPRGKNVQFELKITKKEGDL